MTRRGWVGLAGLVLVASGALWWGLRPAGAPAIASQDVGDAPGGWHALIQASAESEPGLQSGVEGLPASLQGTELDGQVRADAQGRLVVDRALRDRFDYFLSLIGEEPEARVLARLDAHLKSLLPPQALATARDLLARYMAFQQARSQLGQQGPQAEVSTLEPDMLRARFERIQALKLTHFDAQEVAAFFGDDDAEDRYTLARLSLWRDASLDSTAKALRLKALQAQLPPSLRERLTVADTVADLRALREDWQSRGGDAQALRSARLALVGQEVTDRLEALDARRDEWRERVASYLQGRAALQADASLSSTLREQAELALRQRHFAPQEWPRLDAWTQAQAQGVSLGSSR